MSQVYITALFGGEAAANDAKRALAEQPDIAVHRSFVVHRDEAGFHVDGRYAGEAPKHWYALLAAALTRMVLGTSREEDSIAIDDAEQALGMGQAALVALIDEDEPNTADATIHAYGGSLIRLAPGTLDADDTERFLSASSLTGFGPTPKP